MAHKRLTAKQLRSLVESVINERTPADEGRDAVMRDDVVLSLKQAVKWLTVLEKKHSDSYQLAPQKREKEALTELTQVSEARGFAEKALKALGAG